ncbi:MAG TPA: AmmeMemoRadiSam system protein A [Candidatus Mailhella merdavium]|nr:AmmeMemoRadiSam system protein A [Candidatus Mailhella merdavium]
MSGLSLPLTEAEEHFLLDCARASIRRGVRLPLPEDFAFLNGDGEPDSRAMEQTLLAAQARVPRLLTPSGAFVTLHGTATGVPMLRGCIGLMEPVMPLALAVLRMGWAAAFSDYRFSPLRAAEVPDLELDISVLGPLSPAAPEDIELGRHGVKLEALGRSAVFLPQVPPEQGWNLSQTLEALRRKAGLPPETVTEEAFREGRSRLFTYEAFLIGPQKV